MESVCRWTVLACHCNTKLRPFTVASSSTKFICWVSFVGQSHYASSRMSSCLSNATPVAKELVSTHVFNSSLDTLQLPWTGSSRVTLTSTSFTTCLRETSSTGLSPPLVTTVTRLFRASAITRSQPQTGKWPTNFPHMENMVGRVIPVGDSGIAFPCFQR